MLKNAFLAKSVLSSCQQTSFIVVTEHRFQLTFGGERVTVIIEAQQLQRLPSELIFAQCVLKQCVYRR